MKVACVLALIDLGECPQNELTATILNFIFRLDALALSVIATATWLAGWLGVCHSRYCIKTTEPILKPFGPPGSPIIYAFRTPYADTKFQG